MTAIGPILNEFLEGLHPGTSQRVVVSPVDIRLKFVELEGIPDVCRQGHCTEEILKGGGIDITSAVP